MMLFGGLAAFMLAVFLWELINQNAQQESDKEKRKGRPHSARDILDERYANGDISQEEYLTILEDIETNKQYL